MSNDRRRGRGRPFALAITACAVTLLAPLATAQESAIILLPESPPAPGAEFVATFRVPGGPLDLGVQDHVTCVLVGSGGEDAACDWRGEILTLRVMPTSVDYVLPLAAPAAEGDYTLRITRAPFADSTFQTVSAEAALQVRAILDEPLDAGDEDGGAPAPSSSGGTTNIWNIFVGRDAPAADADPESADDAERWMVSSTMGSAALLALVVAGRKGGFQ